MNWKERYEKVKITRKNICDMIISKFITAKNNKSSRRVDVTLNLGDNSIGTSVTYDFLGSVDVDTCVEAVTNSLERAMQRKLIENLVNTANPNGIILTIECEIGRPLQLMHPSDYADWLRNPNNPDEIHSAIPSY